MAGGTDLGSRLAFPPILRPGRGASSTGPRALSAGGADHSPGPAHAATAGRGIPGFHRDPEEQYVGRDQHSTLPNIVGGAGALTIDGGGVVVISGDHCVPVMAVHSGAILVLKNLYANWGGGVLNTGVLTVIHSAFVGNIANGSGGGILNQGTLTVTDSTFSGNTAGYGAASTTAPTAP